MANMNIKIISMTVMITTFALTGCASTAIKNMDSFQKTPLREAEIMPSKAALAGAKPRVIVFELEDKKGSGAGDEVADAVIKELNVTKNVIIVDRSLAQTLNQEIQLAETKGQTDYRGQDVADFAITGKITAASAGNSFTAASTYKGKDGQYYTNPARCTTSGKIDFSVKISRVPSLDVVATLAETATASMSQDGYCSSLNQAEARGIISAAAANAIQKIRTDLKNQFAPTGYVLERRVHDKDSIFKISLGKSGGAQQDLKVAVMHATTEKNSLTGTLSTEHVKIADAMISDQVGDSYAYIVVTDNVAAENIKLGDVAKVQFEESFMDKMNKVVH